MIIDWGGGAHTIDYFQAAANTRSVGAYSAQVIENLLRVPGSASSRMWCVGHSLGAHVCGHTGMKMPSGLPLGRATGRHSRSLVFARSCLFCFLIYIMATNHDRRTKRYTNNRGRAITSNVTVRIDNKGAPPANIGLESDIQVSH